MSKEKGKRSLWKWKEVGAVFSFFGGVLGALLGGLLTASTWILGPAQHRWLQGLGTLLLVSIIPLLIFCGCCLDWLECETDKTLGGKSHAERGSARLASVISAVVFLFTLCAAIELRAQQTIFNVPTTDVLSRGKVYAELDASFKPNNSASLNRFSSFVPRIVVGAGRDIEVGLNLVGNNQPGPAATTLVPTAKWKLYQGKDNAVALVLGDNFFIPIRNRSYTAGNYVYGEISKTFKNGPRLTLGGYDFTANVVASANRAGGQFGLEWPLSGTLSFAADWFTGKHSAGYFTPGIVFKIGPKVTGYAGYSIGNQSPSHGNHFVLLEFGYNFN